jgi:hypothetical protein
MAGRRDGTVRGDLAQAARQFAQWRRTHAYGSRIPQALWDSAVELAAEYGVSRTAMSLKLGYYDLKKRLGARTSAGALAQDGGAFPTFVEFTPAALDNACECTIELEKRDGSRMRIAVKGASVPDLAAVSRSFWELA